MISISSSLIIFTNQPKLRVSLTFTLLLGNLRVAYHLPFHHFDLRLPLLGHLKLLNKRHLLLLHHLCQLLQFFSLVKSLINSLAVAVTCDRVVVLVISHPRLLRPLLAFINALKIKLRIFQRITPILFDEFFYLILFTFDLHPRGLIGQKLIKFLFMNLLFDLSLGFQKSPPIFFLLLLLLHPMLHLFIIPLLF